MARFEQTTYRETLNGQTSAYMFLEDWNACGRPLVYLLRQTEKGSLRVVNFGGGDLAQTEADVLRAVLRTIDGQLTAFEGRDESLPVAAGEVDPEDLGSYQTVRLFSQDDPDGRLLAFFVPAAVSEPA